MSRNIASSIKTGLDFVFLPLDDTKPIFHREKTLSKTVEKVLFVTSSNVSSENTDTGVRRLVGELVAVKR